MLRVLTRLKFRSTPWLLQILLKGQTKPKADWCAVDSPIKQTNEFVLFAFLLFTANKLNLFVRFMGESTAHQSAFGFI